MEHYNDWFGDDWCGETRDEEWAEVDQIRALNSKGISCYRLAKMYSVSKKSVLDIIHNKTWVKRPYTCSIPKED